MITTGGKLAAEYVIHTVGPVWQDGQHNEANLLADCYRNSLSLAVEHGLKTVAFPNISTGVYRFPKELAAQIAIIKVVEFLEQDTSLEQVIFVCFDEENYRILSKLDGNKLRLIWIE